MTIKLKQFFFPKETIILKWREYSLRNLQNICKDRRLRRLCHMEIAENEDRPEEDKTKAEDRRGTNFDQ